MPWCSQLAPWSWNRIRSDHATKFRYQDTWLGMRITDSSGGNLVFRGDGTPQAPEAVWVAMANFSSQQLQVHCTMVVTGAVAPFILFCPDGFYNRWFWCISVWSRNAMGSKPICWRNVILKRVEHFIWLADFEGGPSSPKLASLKFYDNFKSNISWQCFSAWFGPG